MIQRVRRIDRIDARLHRRGHVLERNQALDALWVGLHGKRVNWVLDADIKAVGMHGFWWLFWLLMIGVWFFSGWGRSGRRGNRPRETAHELLSRRLAGGEITPQQYEERRVLLDRDAVTKD